MSLKPPRWADRFLEWYCRPDLLEEIQGDAYELFYRQVRVNKRKANLSFTWNVLRFFRLKNIRKINPSISNSIITPSMLKNIFKVAFRNFISQPGHSFLNVLGLTVSFVAAFFIFLWVTYEYSYDRFHSEPEKIFKVLSHVEANGGLETYDAAEAGMDVTSIPEVEEKAVVITGSRWPNELCFRPEGKSNECIYLNGIYTENSFLSIFNYPVISGDQNPLKNPTGISVSENMANLLYGFEDPIGKTIKIDDYYEVTIVSVFKNTPSNSSLQFDFLLPLDIFKRMRGLSNDQFYSDFISSYLKTNSEISQDQLTAKLNQSPVLTENLKKDKVSYAAYPFTQWRLNDKFENGKNIGGRIEYVNLFIGIALLAVIMAVINFVNLSTARATTRSKEIGIRKVTGAFRSGIIVQFVCESFIIVLIAFLLAAGITQIILPYFNVLVGETLNLSLISGWIPYCLLGFLLLISLAAGLYPAIIMSGFEPAKVLKGEVSTRQSGTQQMRKFLLVFQLSASIGIVIFTGILFKQISFITHKNLGIDRENILRIEPTYTLLKQYAALKADLLAHPQIKSVTASNGNPVNMSGRTTGVSWQGMPENSGTVFQILGCNYELPQTFGLTILQGRSFTPDAQDTINSEVLVSEEAVKIMGFENPIGALFKVGDVNCKIIGVVNDFHTESLRKQKLPVVLYAHPILNCSYVFVKYEEGTTQEAMEIIQAAYKKIEPAFTMKYSFQDEAFGNLYKTETIASKMVILFTSISLIVAIIGVVGLATYNVIRRRKEIGIKRVFGATVPGILAMLTKEFTLIITLATVLAMPLTWYVADNWLSGFAYHIEMPWWIYASTLIGLVGITIFIICIQGFKTVITSPTKVLRSE
ncbi:MAG: ABC transporter permease [Cyclobacteriaceae bacterium]|nr:ABC transporter permease [Cyclobacteriaceae bacterium]